MSLFKKKTEQGEEEQKDVKEGELGTVMTIDIERKKKMKNLVFLI